MKEAGQDNTRADKKAELEILEKKVEIQKKRIEIKKEKASLQALLCENEKKKLDLIDKKSEIESNILKNRSTLQDMEGADFDRKIEKGKLLDSNVFTILMVLASKTIDEDRTIIGSEPFFIPIVSGNNRKILINKMMELVKNF